VVSVEGDSLVVHCILPSQCIWNQVW